jgi:macrodomain Ter protein organizer (MatP/YcbG family)
MTNLEHLIDTNIINVRGVGSIKISQVDTQKTSRTSRQHGVAWWVDKRLVGEPSWKGFDGDGFLDRRTSEAKRYTFVVEADVLSDDVREDWSGFQDTENFRKVRAAAKKHIRKRLMELMSDIHKARKKAAIEANKDTIRTLSSESRFYIGQMVDGIQERIPTVKQDVLSTTVKVLSNLEKARTGYTLLEQIASLKPDELDQLSEILDKWSVQAARVVLGELERRLSIISKLEKMTEDSSSDELHDIHPLFVQGLWMFGPEYESVHFRSNKALSTVIRELLENKLDRPLSTPLRRPDIVVLPDSTVSIHASDSFDTNAEVDGVEKVLVIELKRGGKSVGVEEYRQGDDYAIELRKSGKVQNSTKIVVYVLGTNVDQDVEDDTDRGNVTIRARSYSVILKRAHARTFHLIEKIKEVKEDLLDLDVEEAIQKTEFFA